MAVGEHGHYTISQAAALLGVSRVSIWRWIRDGHLPATRLGPRTIRITREDLDRMHGQIRSIGSRSRVAQDQTGRAEIPHDFGSTGDATELHPPDHAVQFYETDAFLLDAVTEFIAGALTTGDAGIVVATKRRRNGVAERLRASGLDLDDALTRGCYTSLDAAETLSTFMIGTAPDAERFADVVGAIVTRAAEGGRRVRIFGEMVALLAADGNYAGAVRLEELWNDLQRNDRFSLLCAYPIGRLGADRLTGVLSDLCATHTRVIPAESYTQLTTENDRLRAVVELQQKAHWLETQIHVRRGAEEQLRIALAAEQDALQEAIDTQRTRDELVSVAVQELKHPLYSLSLQAQHALLQLGRETQLQPERVERAVEATSGQPTEITRLIGHMVEFSRIETGRLTLQPRWVDLTNLVEHVVADMRVRSNQHVITLAVPSSLEAWVDPERTEQVLINLVDNAIRYSPDGGTIDIALTRSPSTGVTLTVWDHGRGIPPDKRGALFEHDETSDTVSHRGQGLRLGLFISRQIVELHGGELYVEFPIDGGTRFVMRLPVEIDDAIAQAAAD